MEEQYWGCSGKALVATGESKSLRKSVGCAEKNVCLFIFTSSEVTGRVGRVCAWEVSQCDPATADGSWVWGCGNCDYWKRGLILAGRSCKCRNPVKPCEQWTAAKIFACQQNHTGMQRVRSHVTEANVNCSFASTKKQAVVHILRFFSPSFLSLTGHEIPIKMKCGVSDRLDTMCCKIRNYSLCSYITLYFIGLKEKRGFAWLTFWRGKASYDSIINLR